jgi:hypothetical protein
MKRLLCALTLLACVACGKSKDSDKNDSGTDTPVPVAPTFAIEEVKVDASQKSVWVYYGLQDSHLVAMKKEEAWIVAVSRYMWQTNTGSSGLFTGGAYKADSNDFDAVKTCDSKRFVADKRVVVQGFEASVNMDLTSWFDTKADVKTPVPLDANFIVGRDKECVKLRVLTYDQGLYNLKIQRLQ